VAADEETLEITAAHIDSGALIVYPADDGTAPKGYDPDLAKMLRSAAAIMREQAQLLEEWGEFKTNLKRLINDE